MSQEDFSVIDFPDEPVEIAPDVAPRGKERGGRAKGAAAPLPAWKAGSISTFVTRVYTQAGHGFTLLGRPVYGAAIADVAGPAGAAWEKVAKRHEALRRVFDKLMTTSDVSELFWVHFPLVMLIMSDAGLFNTVVAEVDAELVKESNGQPRS